jgi:alpha-mannosidase
MGYFDIQEPGCRMKRREVLKGISLFSGAVALGHPALSAADQAVAGTPVTKIAQPVRGLRRIAGRLQQPIRLTLETSSAHEAVVTSIDGIAVDRRSLAAGKQTFDIFIDPVARPMSVDLAVRLGDATLHDSVQMHPVRKMQVYILPHSHHDLGYTELQSDVEERQIRNISLGIDLARRTAGYPEGSRFVWNLEVLWGADLYMRRKSSGEKAAFLEAVREGWVALNGSYANELTGLCRPEELLQLFRYGTQLSRQAGTTIDSAMMSDVPGYTWGTVDAMAQAGIRYFSSAPNYFDRIGRFMDTLQDKPFWWVSKSGKAKVLFWIPWTGYAMSHVMTADDEWVGKYQERMDEVRFPYDISYVRWAGHGDNAEPDPGIAEFTRAWNATYEWPRFTIASTSTAFAAFERRYGSQLPQMQGDLTPYWEDGAASSALETAINRNTADRLTQAAILFALRRPRAYKADAFNDAWRDVLLFSEHTWGAAGSVTQPEAAMTVNQWSVKRAFALDAEQKSRALLAEARALSDPVQDKVDVVNTSSWPRGGIVLFPRELSSAGDRVVDIQGRALPSQRLATGELATQIPELPGLSTARFTVTRGSPAPPAIPVAYRDGELHNGHLRVRIDQGSGDIVELAIAGSDANLVDTRNGWTLNEFVLLQGDDVQQLGKSGTATITVEENGPLVVSLRVASSAPLCESLVRRVRLGAGHDFLELDNTVNKLRAGYASAMDDKGRHPVLKESIQFAFPFAVENGQLTIDVPFAQVRPELDQLPGSCKNWMPVSRWVDVSNTRGGITWVTLDAPLVEVGGITATKLNSQTDPEVWLRHLDPTQTFFSWVMNNHWGTNYRAWQEGPVTFRYVLRPHAGADFARATQFATGLSQPLLVMAATGALPAVGALLHAEPADIVLEELKPSADGKGWIVRLFNASDRASDVRLSWSPHAEVVTMSRCNLAEEPAGVPQATFTLAASELMIIRASSRG